MNIVPTRFSIAALMACGLLWAHPSHAEDQRYLAIQHTDTVYANQGVCAYHFSLDSGGADQLIGRGDMLLATGSDLIRLQCAFVDTPEVDRISDFIGNQRGYPDAYLLPEYIDENGEQKMVVGTNYY